MLQHWSWLVAGLPPSTPVIRPDLAEAKRYVKEFLENGDSEASESSLSMNTAMSIIASGQEPTEKTPFEGKLSSMVVAKR